MNFIQGNEVNICQCIDYQVVSRSYEFKKLESLHVEKITFYTESTKALLILCQFKVCSIGHLHNFFSALVQVDVFSKQNDLQSCRLGFY